ncbi:hypothetical protein [Paraburkholderia sp. BL25I1N1]|uniref:hypothetical protein n=1 Tax=Paraburkholderia sp. BL25I1N1 TaxID=1938804 RepID=UPI000D06E5D1|nr:hypothetical protein B0G73_13614 [Paraburkholderia sp. BL25I1N1]
MNRAWSNVTLTGNSRDVKICITEAIKHVSLDALGLHRLSRMIARLPEEFVLQRGRDDIYSPAAQPRGGLLVGQVPDVQCPPITALMSAPRRESPANFNAINLSTSGMRAASTGRGN